MGIIDLVKDLPGDVKDFFSGLGEQAFAHEGAVHYVAAAAGIALLNRNRRSISLDSRRRELLRYEYGEIVDEVRITFGADMVELKIGGRQFGTKPAGQTFGNNVYIRAANQPEDRDQLELIAHELMHVKQFRRLGSNLYSFGREYFSEYYKAGFDYDENDMEEEADRIASCVVLRAHSTVRHQVLWRGDPGTWSEGWTLFVPFQLGGQPYMLRYGDAAGSVRVDQVKPDGTGVQLLRRDDWSSGWSSIMPFVINGEPYLLSCKHKNGAAKIDRIRPLAEWVDQPAVPWWEKKWEATWEKGWTHLVPHVIGGTPHALAYKSSSGRVRMYKLSPGGAESVWEDDWGEGWSSFLPFTFNNEPHQLVYKFSNGHVRVDKMKPGGQGVDVLWRGNWSGGWTHFTPLAADGRDYLAYKGPFQTPIMRIPGRGIAHVSRLRGEYTDSEGSHWTESRWCGTWAKEWDTLVTFPIGNTWHALAYDRTAGSAHMDSFVL